MKYAFLFFLVMKKIKKLIKFYYEHKMNKKLNNLFQVFNFFYKNIKHNNDLY